MLTFKKRCSRRAQIESQFSWMFVLIAGAVILAFFFSVVQKQRDVSQQKLAMTLAYDFEAVLGSAAVAKGASQPLSLYGQEIQFSCSDTCACGMSVGDFQRPFREKIIFSQSKINGKNMLLWTLDWKNPFRVANFVYATDDNTYYWFVGDSNGQVIKYLSTNFTKLAKFEVVPSLASALIKDKGFKKNRIVVVGTTVSSLIPSNIQTLPGVSMVNIITDNLGSGQLKFYSLKTLSLTATIPQTTTPITYSSTEHLLGAIFSEDANMYICGEKNSQTRFGVIKETYLKRVTTPYLRGLRNCGGIYGRAETALSTFDLNTLKNINQELMMASCPTIY